jgi:putative oxidoreductase
MGLDKKRLLIPGLAHLYAPLSPFAYAFMRFVTGAILLPHGYSKLFFSDPHTYADGIGRHGLPFPLLLAWLMILTESIGAALLAIGLLTRVAAVAIWIEMFIITFIYQWPNGYLWTNKGYEFSLLWLLLVSAIFFRGGGRYSVDRLIGKEF